ncbi:EAL domain-containing protein [Marichromatium bheemlicum]|uniref:EAL domain-containing protein n=1 Tax=Marichromatium bheemlicum TaxID=365339 RepID=A0ABX1I7V8_9GAMM|nr:EAL domain-containing protein [Marichromatium bheemlicum]NKN33650.1 EAL domain-containing protein [Marichromatium bheemlicum]
MSLLSAIPMGALLLDQGLRIIEVNRPLLDLLGRTPQSLPGTAFGELLAPTSHARLAELDPDAPPRHLRAALITASGPLDAALTLSPCQDQQSRWLVMVTETSTVPSHHPVEEAQAFARVANWQLEVATGQVQVTRTWYDIWGLAPTETLMLEDTLRRIHPDDRPRVEQALEQAAESHAPIQVRFRVQRPDGNECWIEGTGHIDPCASAQAPQVCGVVMDITERYRAEQALAHYGEIVSAASERLAFVDTEQRVRAANRAFLNAIERDYNAVIDQPLVQVIIDADLSVLLQRALQCCFEDRHEYIEDLRRPGPEGEPRDLEIRVTPHHDDDGRLVGAVINVRDVTLVREAERRLLQSAAVYAATSEGVLITDPEGCIVAVNAAFSRITGYTESEVVGRNPNLLNSHWHPRSFFVGMWRHLLKHGSWIGEIWNRRKDGEIYLQRLAIHRIVDARGNLLNYVGVFAEHSATLDTPRRAEYLAHYDQLTKLPNRLLFHSRLEHAIELRQRKQTPLALFLIDLDHFANINTHLGPQIGDELLRSVALRLRSEIRPADTLARLSANQFGLIFEEIPGVPEAESIAQRLQRTLASPFNIREHEVFVTASIGIAFDPSSGRDRDLLLAKAESALRSIKQAGRNAYRCLAIQSDAAEAERQRIIGQLRAGLERGEFQLHYQPRVDIETGQWFGIEAMVRWNQPQLGLVAPERFLPLTDDGGFLVELGHWTLNRACEQFRHWHDRGLPVGRLALNVSEALLLRLDLARTIARALDSHGLVGEQLELEFSEGLLLKHSEQVVDLFNTLHQLGVHLTLRDVGAGWIAPSLLRRLPVGTLKIHRGFIENLPGAQEDLDVVHAVVALAQSFEIGLLADGVRTEEQRDMLLTIGCPHAQGELYAPPLAIEQLEHRLTRRPEPQPPKPRES